MIKIAIFGYGNIGRGVKRALERNNDMELVSILTRRPAQVQQEVADVPVLFHFFTDLPLIDVAILCGGSKEDIRAQGPEMAKRFNTVDSFDIHPDILKYFQKMDAVAKESGNVSIISAGWDPGIFSLERVLGDAFLPESKTYTFWGIGVSQGHSNAARDVKGVLDARAYTSPYSAAIQQVRAGETPNFSKAEMHRRFVFVVAEKGANTERIKKEITETPDQFKGYDTEVVFISKEEMAKDHSAYPHRGFVITSGMTGKGNKQILEYRCQLESNPEFTANVLVACARAAYRMREKGDKGAFTLLNIPLGLLSPHSDEVLMSPPFM